MAADYGMAKHIRRDQALYRRRVKMARRIKKAHDEGALRAMLEAHRGDLSLYERRPEEVKLSTSGGSIVFSLRFSRTELEDLRLQAEARGMSLSEMIRKAALDWGQSHRYQVVVQPQPTYEISIAKTRSVTITVSTGRQSSTSAA